ncbi:MAG: MFS transporter [Paracoccaceae bacterium]
MFMLRLSLMLVVFVDVMGQGLILPIISTLLIDPESAFLAKDTSHGTRNLMYGVLLSTFYIFWFFGAAYISKLSDYIGRKNGIVICLVGALAGYVLTVVAVESSNYALLLLGRAISGFTAGNQPIAQAALVDISRNDDERTRNMGRVVAAAALGLVAGPLIAGLLSDSRVLGSYATLQLPFMVAAGLIAITLFLILVFFHDARTERRKIDFGVSEVFVNLWRVRSRPVVLKLGLVFFFFELGLNSFFIYLNDYALQHFGFDTLQNSILMVIFGLTMALASSTLVGPLGQRYRKIPVVTGATVVMMLSLIIFTLNPVGSLSYLLVIPIVIGFAVGYPTILALFSASAGEEEQGWVMGITIALFTLGSGLVSLAGGVLIGVNVHLPFAVGILCCGIALALIATLWRGSDVQAIDTRQMQEPSS